MYGIVDEQNNRPLAQSKFLNVFKISACSCSYTQEADIFSGILRVTDSLGMGFNLIINLTINHVIGTVQDKKVNRSRREQEPTNTTTTTKKT